MATNPRNGHDMAGQEITVRNFYAVFHNAAGWSLSLVFRHDGWRDIEVAAHAALAAKPEHARNGPWEIYTVDVHA
jgi:hypothetical protein